MADDPPSRLRPFPPAPLPRASGYLPAPVPARLGCSSAGRNGRHGRDREGLERIAVVGHQHRPAPGRPDEGEVPDIPRCEEAALRGGHGREAAVAITLQPQALAGVGAGDTRLDIVEVARHEQIEVPVAIDVEGNDAADW